MTVGLQSLGPRVVRRFSPKPEWHPTLEASDLLGCYAGLSPWNRYMYIYIYPNSLLLELSISFAKLNSPWMVKPPHLPMFRGKMSIFLGSNSVFLRCRFPEARAQRDEPRAKARLYTCLGVFHIGPCGPAPVANPRTKSKKHQGVHEDIL